MVVVLGMNALDRLRQEWNDIAVASDIVVITALAVLGLATGNQVFRAEGPVAFGRRAVDDQQRDFLEGF
jgi:hypothetical protein